MWELDHKQSWAPKNWCFWTVVLEKTLESPLDCKEIKPVNPKGNQSWIFTGRTDVEAETPILWPPHVKNWLIGKDPNSGKDWRREEKGTTEDEMVGWHHRCNVHEFEQAPGAGEGQWSLLWCSPWSHKESDRTERMNGVILGKERKLDIDIETNGEKVIWQWMQRGELCSFKPENDKDCQNHHKLGRREEIFTPWVKDCC